MSTLLFWRSQTQNCFSENKFPLTFDVKTSDFTINSMDYNEVNMVLAFGGEANSMPYVGLYYDQAPIHSLRWMYNY